MISELIDAQTELSNATEPIGDPVLMWFSVGFLAFLIWVAYMYMTVGPQTT